MTHFLYGQQLTFMGHLVDTITIVSSSGYYHFDKKETSTDQSEQFVITYDLSQNKYTVANYKNIFSIWTNNPESSNEVIKEKNKVKGQVIPINLIDGLLKSFSYSLKPAFDNIGISQQIFSKMTNKKHIHRIAKIYKQKWQFLLMDKKEKNLLFTGCQSIDTFNLFLSSNLFNTSGYPMVTDYGDDFTVHIKTQTNKYVFQGKYPNKFKQPWYNLSDTTMGKTDSLKEMFNMPKPILNFRINHYLVEILPSEFYRRKVIEIQALTNQYILWYLQRRNIIDEYN